MTKLVHIKAAGQPQAAPFLAHGMREELYVVDLPEPPRNGLAPSKVQRRLQVFAALMAADVAILLGSFVVTGFGYLIVYRGQFSMDTALLSGYLLLPIFLTIGLFNGTYSGTTLFSWKSAAFRVSQALVVSALLLNFFAFFAKMNAEFSRFAFLASTVAAMALMSGLRIVLVKHGARIWGSGPLNRLLIVASEDAVDMPGAYRVDAREHGLVPDLNDPVALDRLAKYLRNMDHVLVSCPEQERAAWSQVLKGSGLHAEVISPIARDIGALSIKHYGQADFSTLVVSVGALRVRDQLLKRTFDIVVSAGALLLLSPLLALVALAILIEDGGPVLFRQRRMGQGNTFFQIAKFRSMRVAGSDANGVQSASRDDDRVTRVGRIIRRTSLDELPQLLNVLAGDMSIVGPRPHALGSHAGEKLFWEVDRRYWLRHTLRPGITGLAQVRGYRGATDTEDDLANRLQSDLEYLRDWSLLRDIRIILSTLRVLVHDRAF